MIANHFTGTSAQVTRWSRPLLRLIGEPSERRPFAFAALATANSPALAQVVAGRREVLRVNDRDATSMPIAHHAPASITAWSARQTCAP